MASDTILKSFIIGSSAPVFLPILYRVAHISDDCKNYPYKPYSWIAPIYFGITSSIAAILRHRYNIPLFHSLLIITIISIAFVLSLVISFHLYNFTTNQQWYQYVSRLVIFHSIAYLTIYYITKYI